MQKHTILVRQPAIRSFMSLFSEAGDVMRRRLSAALLAAFEAGRTWGKKPIAGEAAFVISLDGVIRPHTVRANASYCRRDYAAATRRPWSELQKAGFRVQKIRLVPVSK